MNPAQAGRSSRRRSGNKMLDQSILFIFAYTKLQ
jgi:hypothetical protein